MGLIPPYLYGILSLPNSQCTSAHVAKIILQKFYFLKIGNTLFKNNFNLPKYKLFGFKIACLQYLG